MTQAHINGAVLRWARERAQLSPEEAVARAKIAGSSKVSAMNRLLAWENGVEFPTLNQVRALAKTYHRPLLTFYLTAPPSEDRQIPDFRKATSASDHNSAALDALVRRMRARQQEIREILLDEGASRLQFVGGQSVDLTKVRAVVGDIRARIGLSIAEQRRAGDQDALFRLLRARVEDAGIFVQVVGDLGSHHTAIPPDEFRGMALADDIAPFVVINANDARAAFVFTLLHEVSHIWTGQSGISNASPFDTTNPDKTVELFCNAVAGEFLLPKSEFLSSWDKVQGSGPIANAVAGLAREWRVSRAVVAHRLWSEKKISADTWWGLYRIYQQEWRRRRERQKDRKGGPTYYVTTKSHLGGALIATVLRAMDAGTVTYTQAARILNVKAKAFDGLRDSV